MKYYIKTFGCQQNVADSERIKAAFAGRGMTSIRSYRGADYIIINTCMVRESAENRVYGLVNNLEKLKIENCTLKIIVTGCMVGLAFRDKTGKYLARLKKIMPAVDEFMPIEEVGFDHAPLRTDHFSAWVVISHGCNNFCTFCVVPFTRGREVSRPYDEIIAECRQLKKQGYTKVTLLGQNVNSYGADLLRIENFKHKPIYVKHLGRFRIPTLFPYLLEEVAKMGFETVDFISSNPWDFSSELIEVIAHNQNITRIIHLPIQSGDDAVLKRMNRWYTADEYLQLVANLKMKIKKVQLTTDIIVGFCGETDEQFQNTVKLCQKVSFQKAYIAMYSQRPAAAAPKVFADDVPHPIKKKRWQTLDRLINHHAYAPKKSI